MQRLQRTVGLRHGVRVAFGRLELCVIGIVPGAQRAILRDDEVVDLRRPVGVAQLEDFQNVGGAAFDGLSIFCLNLFRSRVGIRRGHFFQCGKDGYSQQQDGGESGGYWFRFHSGC
jgi:hypothetical protein